MISSCSLWSLPSTKKWTHSDMILPTSIYGRFLLMSCLYHRLPHRWLRGLTRKAFLLRPPRPRQLVSRCRSLRRPGGPHGHGLGRPLSRPPKASVWSHVQDQPRSTCLVRRIWVKDQHAQHWPWTLSHWKQGRLAPLASTCSGSMAYAEHAGP